MKLSHKELVKFGRIEASKGDSLNKIETDFIKKGVDKKDALKALDEVDYYNKIDKSKKEAKNAKPAASSKKSALLPLVILILLICAVIYLFYFGLINLDLFRSINFK